MLCGGSKTILAEDGLMKKEGKKRGGKVVAGSATVVVIAALAMFGGKAFGFGGGSGTGEDGDRNVVSEQNSSNIQEADTTDATEITTEAGETIITIEIVKNKYFIDGEEKNLSEVELIVRRANSDKTTFILEDNYASSKAWDDVREIFINLEISVIEQ